MAGSGRRERCPLARLLLRQARDVGDAVLYRGWLLLLRQARDAGDAVLYRGWLPLLRQARDVGDAVPSARLLL